MDKSKIIFINNIHPQVNIVNYFELKPNRSSWGPRIIPDFELIFIREGRCVYDEHEQTDSSFPDEGRKKNGVLQTELKQGDVLLIPPGISHSFKAVSDRGEISCIHCLPMEGLSWGKDAISLSPTPLYRTSFGKEISMIDTLFFKCDKYFSGYNQYREELLSTICKEIWLHCASKWKMHPNNRILSKRMNEMMLFIKDNCTGKIGRGELAERFSLTPEYINALFKREMGMSPISCINKERILLGYSFIHNEGVSVKEAAYRTGFNDPFYFSRVFKKILGVTPETLRGRNLFY